jgi:hypothetical protein
MHQKICKKIIVSQQSFHINYLNLSLNSNISLLEHILSNRVMNNMRYYIFTQCQCILLDILDFEKEGIKISHDFMTVKIHL